MHDARRSREGMSRREKIAWLVAGAIATPLAVWGVQSSYQTHEAFDRNTRTYLQGHGIPECSDTTQKPCLEEVTMLGARIALRDGGQIEVSCAFDQAAVPGCYTGTESNPYKTLITGPESIS